LGEEGIVEPLKEGEYIPEPTQKRLITVELFPRSGDFPKTPSDSIGRIIELRDRVKVTTKAVGNIYEFTVFANWLRRFLGNLGIKDDSNSNLGGSASQAADARQIAMARALFRSAGRGNDEEQSSDEERIVLLQEYIVRAAHLAMKDYFDDLRPVLRTQPSEFNDDCSVNTEYVQRREEINLVGLDPKSLAAINDFDQRLAHAVIPDRPKTPREQPPTEKDLQERRKRVRDIISRFVQSPLVRNQVTRFSNTELLPLRTTVRSGLLGPADFSANTIRARYEAGLKLAEEQLVVAKFEDANGKEYRDLMYVPQPNGS
jgi:hypothetical protein